MKPRRKGEVRDWLEMVWKMKPCNGCGVVAGQCLCKYIKGVSMSLCYITSFKEGGVDCYAIININVTYFYEQSPDPKADNDWDYHGYTDIEWEVEKIDVFSEETEELVYTIDNPSPEYIEMNYDITLSHLEEWIVSEMEQVDEED